ncbi:hypothetical protein [Mesorhizobium sp. 128a]
MTLIVPVESVTDATGRFLVKSPPCDPDIARGIPRATRIGFSWTEKNSLARAAVVGAAGNVVALPTAGKLIVIRPTPELADVVFLAYGDETVNARARGRLETTAFREVGSAHIRR